METKTNKAETSNKVASSAPALSSSETSALVMAAITGGYEVKQIDGNLRMNHYETVDKMTTKSEVIVNVQTGELRFQLKQKGNILEQAVGSAVGFSKIKGDNFDVKLKTILTESLKKNDAMAAFKDMSVEDIEKLKKQAGIK